MSYQGVLIVHKQGEDIGDLLAPFQEQEDGEGWWDRWKFWKDDSGNIDPPPEIPISRFSPAYCCDHVLLPNGEMEYRDDDMDDGHWCAIVNTMVRAYPDHVLTVAACHS